MPVMRRLALVLLALLVLATPANADTPTQKTLYADGPQGRYLLDGPWLLKLDASDQGLRHHWERSRSSGGWKRVTVPNVWNLGDPSVASMEGGVGWYRKDFSLPSKSAALRWAVRFESVNYRAQVWLNGHAVGHNTGAYLPFQFDLKSLKRSGVHRLVVRVDSRRKPSDFPPGGLNGSGVPTGGWWNYSGIQREVYLQRIDRVAFRQVVVRPVLSCSTCAARIEARVTLRGAVAGVSVSGTYGGRRLTLRRSGARFSGELRIAKPHLWSPADPYLYPVHLTVRAGGRKVGGYDLHSGIRSIKVVGGRLMLNGS